MCGRYALGLQRAQIRGLPGYPQLEVGEWVDEDKFVPRHNIAPNTNAPVIRRPARHGPLDSESEASSSALVMQTMRWGIQYGKEGSNTHAINARSENLIEGIGMWNKFRGKNRCIVVCQGYYEWQKKGKDKLPHFTKHPDGKVMLMAGLYELTFEKGNSQPTYTFAIVTTQASKALSWLHDRQPVILSTMEDISRWLDTSSQTWSSDLACLLRPWEDTKTPLRCYEVPKEVGKVGTESAKFIEPIANRRDGIQAMFAKQRSRHAEASVKRKRSPSPSSPAIQKITDGAGPDDKKVKLD
ncbi:hypothetical protein PAXRUDRAFT_210084 [Paxillus rubicundulus Ve08.2h10]|uniref:DUF159-domain-containing protein n=1 Tax=Paxillus rubicundulus Ve08.2h10 TaxID=930991 RepID=A0A0D0CZB6_9AGAM|nr:hypothetical protein PAXRUDRAFT_210084 [Paxillus rubicundulus Ve08.2h10]